MANAVNELDRISSDPLARRRAQEREDSIRMYEDSLAVSRREGKAEGKAEFVLKLLTLRFGGCDERRTRPQCLPDRVGYVC